MNWRVDDIAIVTYRVAACYQKYTNTECTIMALDPPGWPAQYLVRLCDGLVVGAIDCNLRKRNDDDPYNGLEKTEWGDSEWQPGKILTTRKDREKVCITIDE